VIVLTGIGLFCSIMIIAVDILIPSKIASLKKIEEVSSILPQANCGACGYPGCFGYAQAVVKNPDIFFSSPCMLLLQDKDRVASLEKILGISIDLSKMSKKAVIHCNGKSDIIYEYSGVNSCKAAAQLQSGYKKCPFACLGFGDCAEVCPKDAIYIDEEKNIAVVDDTKCIGCGRCVVECPQNLIEIVPADTKIVLLCSYKELKNIPGRERCESACIHCKKCYNSCKYDAITWNKEVAMPEFNPEKCTLCYECIKACPNDVLHDFTKMIEGK